MSPSVEPGRDHGYTARCSRNRMWTLSAAPQSAAEIEAATSVHQGFYLALTRAKRGRGFLGHVGEAEGEVRELRFEAKKLAKER